MIWVNARAIIEKTNDGNTEVIVQWRNKKGQECYEFPGGCIEECESFFAALKREVKEETGLDVVEASGQDEYIEAGGVECFKPFSVYQTIKGEFDSMGVHFICKVVGEPLIEGDATKDIKWIGLDVLNKMVETKGTFSSVDRVAALYYLKEKAKLQVNL